VQLAARWLGRFHALSEGRRQRKPLQFLKSHDAEYYGGWARRTLQFAPEFYGKCVWLPKLCERFLASTEESAALKGPVVHGEFTPHNILLGGSCVYPIDWESAAVGIGETDLATLIDGDWGDEAVRECETAYCQTRWPNETPPASHEKALTFSRLYVHLRSLGNRPDVKFEKNKWRLPVLEALGQRAGLI
jgi:thiamine kinase-like enzyme